jgi:hypothetical protein
MTVWIVPMMKREMNTFKVRDLLKEKSWDPSLNFLKLEVKILMRQRWLFGLVGLIAGLLLGWIIWSPK